MKLGLSELMMMFQEEYDRKTNSVHAELNAFLKDQPVVSSGLRGICKSPSHDHYRKIFSVHSVDADSKEIHLSRKGNLHIVSAKDFDKHYDLPSNQSELDKKRNSRKHKNEK